MGSIPKFQIKLLIYSNLKVLILIYDMDVSATISVYIAFTYTAILKINLFYSENAIDGNLYVLVCACMKIYSVSFCKIIV